MKTALVTDGKYRSSIAAVRALHRAGYRVVVTQTRADVKSAPAVSVSKSCDDFRWIDGACADADYVHLGDVTEMAVCSACHDILL